MDNVVNEKKKVLNFTICDLIFSGMYSNEAVSGTNVGINLPLFSTVVPSNICMFLSRRPFVVITLSTGLVGVEVTSVSWLGLPEVTLTPTRPVDNVVITTKGLRDRNIHILDVTTVENKGKLILTNLAIVAKT